MKKILKWILTVLIILFVLLIVTLFFIDEIAKFGIEKIGPKITGVPMKVEDISIHPFHGRIEITGMVIGNPEDGDYKTSYAVFLGNFTADIDTTTLFKPKLVIQEFLLKDIQINYETPVTFIGSNIGDILDHLNEKADEEAQEIAEDKKEGKPKKQLTLQLNKMVIDNVKMVLLVKNTSVEIPLIVTLPEMGPLGTTEEGLTPLGLTKEFSNLIYDTLLKTVMKCKDIAVQEFVKTSATTIKNGGDLGGSAIRAGKKLLKTSQDLIK